MRRFMLPLTFLSLTLMFFVSTAQAQRDQGDRIQSELEEVTRMIDDEQAELNKLERQLKDALDRDENAGIDDLRDRISESFDRLKRLKKLRDQLLDMQDDSARDDKPRTRSQPDRTRSGKTKKRRPKAAFSGLEARDRERDNERGERGRPRADFGGLEPDGPEGGFDRGRARDRDRGNERARGRDRARDRDRGELDNEDRPRESSRLRHLRDALESLNDAGEFGLARSVEQMIRKEEKRLKEKGGAEAGDRDRDRPRGRPRSPRPDTGRPLGNGAFGGSGPLEVDGGGARRGGERRRSSSRERDREREKDDELDEIADELERLRGGGGRS